MLARARDNVFREELRAQHLTIRRYVMKKLMLALVAGCMSAALGAAYAATGSPADADKAGRQGPGTAAGEAGATVPSPGKAGPGATKGAAAPAAAPAPAPAPAAASSAAPASDTKAPRTRRAA